MCTFLVHRKFWASHTDLGNETRRAQCAKSPVTNARIDIDLSQYTTPRDSAVQAEQSREQGQPSGSSGGTGTESDQSDTQSTQSQSICDSLPVVIEISESSQSDRAQTPQGLQHQSQMRHVDSLRIARPSVSNATGDEKVAEKPDLSQRCHMPDEHLLKERTKPEWLPVRSPNKQSRSKQDVTVHDRQNLKGPLMSRMKSRSHFNKHIVKEMRQKDEKKQEASETCEDQDAGMQTGRESMNRDEERYRKVSGRAAYRAGAYAKSTHNALADLQASISVSHKAASAKRTHADKAIENSLCHIGVYHCKWLRWACAFFLTSHFILSCMRKPLQIFLGAFIVV